MDQCVRTLLTAGFLLVCAAAAAAGQSAAFPAPRTAALQVSHVSAPPPLGQQLAAGWDEGAEGQASGRKEPAVAGLLSAFLPGLGSYYAGNSGHGTRHLLIFGAAVTAMAVGASQADKPESDGEGGALLFLAGLTAGFANVIWAVVTGVNDANAHNRASGVASVVSPEVRALESAGAAGRWTTSRGGARFGLQFIRVGF